MNKIIYMCVCVLFFGCSSNVEPDTVIAPENNFSIVEENIDYILTFTEDLDWILTRCAQEDGTINEIAYWEPDEFGVYYRENPSTIICDCAIGIECLILTIPL